MLEVLLSLPMTHASHSTNIDIGTNNMFDTLTIQKRLTLNLHNIGIGIGLSNNPKTP